MTSFNSRNKKLARAGITAAAALCTCLFTYDASAEAASDGVGDGQLRRPRSVQDGRRTDAVQAHQGGGKSGVRIKRRLHVHEVAVMAPVLSVRHRGGGVASDRPSLTALHKEECEKTARS